jgi:hypothetical protein
VDIGFPSASTFDSYMHLSSRDFVKTSGISSEMICSLECGLVFVFYISIPGMLLPNLHIAVGS